MRPFRASVWGCALAVVAAAGGPTQAAWNNVFEACCWNCKSGATANYPPPNPCCQPACPPPCPPQCTTRYVQRCYYQPVTTYTQRSYYEPVTTYKTSYYYEPVTSYHYSCYFDPCTCQYQQVATPCTSYRLRSQCCPVTSYLLRCCYQPCTTYQQAFYYEPVTTCCQTTVGAPVTTLPAGAVATPPQVTTPPQVSDPNTLPPYSPPKVDDGSTQTSESKRFNGNPNTGPAMPKAFDESSRQPKLGSPQPLAPAPVQTPPASKARIDHIASQPAANVDGLVVKADHAPHAGAKLLFVSAERQGAQQSVTTDGHGRFQATLAAGGWLVYLHDDNGRPVFQEKLDVRDDEARTMTLVSRQQ
jgi:hypothetical protein